MKAERKRVRAGRRKDAGEMSTQLAGGMQLANHRGSCDAVVASLQFSQGCKRKVYFSNCSFQNCSQSRRAQAIWTRIQSTYICYTASLKEDLLQVGCSEFHTVSPLYKRTTTPNTICFCLSTAY